MKPPVHILATVRKPELLPAALFVFPTLRVGFPTAQIIVWGNALAGEALAAVRAAVGRAGCAFQNLPATVHDAWIENLILRSFEPFWICDTDVVFWEKVEHWFGAQPSTLNPQPLYAGRHEPEFHEPYTDTVHVERLHTCLMYLDPARIRAAMHAWMRRIPEPWCHTAQFPLLRMHFIPRTQRLVLCYDTLAGLYQAAPGQSFTEEQNLCFDHLAAATYADKVQLPGVDLPAVHREIYARPELARGLQRGQENYYASRAVRPAAFAPAKVREFIAAHTDDELVRMSHANRDMLVPWLREVEGGHGLEIGAWKGESTVWFLEHGLARMDVIEPFTGSQEHRDTGGLREAFYERTREFQDRINLHPFRSVGVLPDLLAQPGRRFDFIYVDGSHESRDVALDALLGFQLLRPDGLMVFDDYLFEFHDNPARNPAAAIDFFLASHAHELTVLQTTGQVVLRKNGEAPSATSENRKEHHALQR